MSDTYKTQQHPNVMLLRLTLDQFDLTAMARVTTKIGDVFSAQIGPETKKYFQYIANDLTQLNSDVIRAFKKEYPLNATPDLTEVVKDEVDFYAHCVTQAGIKQGKWQKAGNVSEIGNLDFWFRSTRDYGSRPGEQINVSHNWHVWKINEDFIKIGELIGEYRKADIGIVVTPDDIVDRMKTGEYDFFFPKFE